MKKLRMLLVLGVYLGICYVLAGAQTSTVSATVTDGDGTVWAGGSWKVEFVPNPSYPSPSAYKIGGVALNPAVMNQSGALDGSGHFSMSVYLNNQVTPVGSQWKLTICPNAVTACGVYTFPANGTPIDLSSTLTPILPLPRFAPVSGTYGYGDFEATLQLKPGSTYWNVTTGIQRCYNTTTSTWGVCNTGGGGGGGTVNEVDTDNASGITGGPITNTGTIACAQASASQFGCMKPDGSTLIASGGVISVSGGGGGGGSYPQIATNADIVWIGSSAFQDDGATQYPTFTISSYTGSAGVYTVTTSSPHGFTAGQWIDMSHATGWSVSGVTGVSAGTNVTVFQVQATGLTSTQFKINVVGGPADCPSSCGLVENAMGYTPYITSAAAGMPSGQLNRTYYLFPTAGPSIANSDSTYNTVLHPRSPAVVGHPVYLVIEDFNNDLYGAFAACSGTDVSIEASFTSLIGKAHADGYVVVTGTMANRGLHELTCPSAPFTVSNINEWMWTQAKSATGGIVDLFADINGTLSTSNTDWEAPNGGYSAAGSNSAGKAIARVILTGLHDTYNKQRMISSEGTKYIANAPSTDGARLRHAFSWWLQDGTEVVRYDFVDKFQYMFGTFVPNLIWLANTSYGGLPSCSFGSGRRGALAFIVDSTTSTLNAVVSGGGTNPVYTYCDGTDWRVMISVSGGGGGVSSPTCNANGCYVQYSDNSYQMWGNSSTVGGATGAANVTITFPVTLASTTNLFLTASATSSATGDGNPHPADCHVTRSTLSTTGATAVIAAAVQIGGSGYANLAAGDYCAWQAYGK